MQNSRYIIEKEKNIHSYISSTPSTGAVVAEGIRLIKMAAFPFIRSRESLDTAWLQHSLSSRPVCLAMAWAIFFTCAIG